MLPAGTPLRTPVTIHELRRQTLEQIASALREALLRQRANGGAYREPPELLRERTYLELVRQIEERVKELVSEQALKGSDAEGLIQIVDDVVKADNAHDFFESTEALQQAWTRLPGVPQCLRISNPGSYFTLQKEWTKIVLEASQPSVTSVIRSAFDRDIADLRFLSVVMQLCADQRRSGRKEWSDADRIAIQHAYAILDRQGRLPAAYAFIRTDQERPYQTYLSFADPGEGHLAVTVQDSALLKGLIVHIEHIDRENEADKSVIEAYRIPPLRTAARIRLHVGVETPCTAYIGRPVFEGVKEGVKYEQGKLKAAHTIAAACSSMFALGIADCKVAMDNLTASQAIDFMQLVAGNVQRDPEQQKLSAAFNINTPLIDDRQGNEKKEVTEKMDIAHLAIALTSAGHFDKVAWDGASGEKSRPILGQQLSARQVLQLVHRAHETGLETYISAGMEPEHMYYAAIVGVGGVGIGLKLHELDPETNRPGPIDRKKVESALEYRDKGAKSWQGQAAQELARLDWDSSRGLLSREIEELRKKLFTTLESSLSDSLQPGNGEPHIEIERPAEDPLRELLGTIEAEYPRQPVAPGDPDDATPISASHSADEHREVNTEPLRVWAERALANFEHRKADPSFESQQLRSSLETEDWDRIRELLLQAVKGRTVAP